MAVLNQPKKTKAKQWGPVSQVRLSLGRNLQDFGIKPDTCLVALPFWSSGIQINFAPNRVSLANEDMGYRRFEDGYLMASSFSPCITIEWLTTNIKDGEYTRISSFGVKNYAPDCFIYTDYYQPVCSYKKGGYLEFYNNSYLQNKMTATVDFNEMTTVGHSYKSSGSKQRIFLKDKKMYENTSPIKSGNYSTKTTYLYGHQETTTGEWKNLAGSLNYSLWFNVCLEPDQIFALMDGPDIFAKNEPAWISLPGPPIAHLYGDTKAGLTIEGAVDTKKGLASNFNISAQLNSNLKIIRGLSGELLMDTNLTGDIHGVRQPLYAGFSAETSFSTDMDVFRSFTAEYTANAKIETSVERKVGFSASIEAESFFEGAFGQPVFWSCIVSANSSVEGGIGCPILLKGDATAATAATGAFGFIKSLRGSVSADTEIESSINRFLAIKGSFSANTDIESLLSSPVRFAASVLAMTDMTGKFYYKDTTQDSILGVILNTEIILLKTID